MNKKSPKPSEIVDAVYDFCEQEKDISKMSLSEVCKGLSQYGINGDDAIKKIKNNILKVKAKSTLKEAATKRLEQLKKIGATLISAVEEAKIQLPHLLGIQAEFAFRNFKSCPDQDLTSMANDLKMLDGINLSYETVRLNEVNPKATAYRLTQMFVITEPKEIDLEAIAMARGILVVDGSLIGCDARLVRKGEKGIIRVGDNLTIGQRRFAIAHELGHWEMHQGLSQWHLCTDENIANYNSSPPELQASAFAAEFLMPTKLFRPLCEDAEPSMELIRELANDFDAGLIATTLRFIELNENPCMAVLSDGKHIRWWRKNDKCRNLWFKSRQEIGGDALVARLPDRNQPVGGQSVPYSAWFKHIESEDRDTIFEQSIKLGNRDSVLTLLWFD